ncbi:pif-3 [Malacosoma neustria nucleopolyhedrovirus]|uniref:pif-3 n=1 Tax=Malacosoma neustria nuclear polyhedrosis virus TaxID=38012 RepID=UPI000E35E13F|nr:pif-3 [Malacosoma neustria nucleopolyhedrovirus]AUF81628.1 pif-3 [Malacosoma neustria nucleopolyhedrovirus]
MSFDDFNNSFIGLVVLIVVLCIVCFYIISTANRLVQDHLDRSRRYNVSDRLNIVFDRNGIVDCSFTRLPCVTDRQCRDNCLATNALSGLVCDEGFCATRPQTVTGLPPENEIECDPKLGLFRAFVGFEYMMNQMCISTYRDVIDDAGNPRPYVCNSGVLDIDVTSRQFSADDCTCFAGYTKMIFNQTALARSIPVCVPNALRNVFSTIYDVV